MGPAAAVFLAGIGTPVIVMTLVLLASIGGGQISRRLSAGAAILSLVPLPLYWFLFRWIVDAHHLILKP